VNAHLADKGITLRSGTLVDGEAASAIDGVDGARSRHRNVPHWVL
jgi:hypothetical protein